MDITEYRLIVTGRNTHVHIDKEISVEFYYGGNESIIIKSESYDTENGIEAMIIPRHILEKFIEMIAI